MDPRIDVHINKAKLNAIAIDLDGGGTPKINANLNLYAGDKLITTVSLGTESWRDAKMDPPLSTYEAIGRIAKDIELQAKSAFMASMKQLKENNEEVSQYG